MSQDKVRMTHPKLPDCAIWVRPAGVKARERAGWKSTPEDTKATATATAAASKKEG